MLIRLYTQKLRPWAESVRDLPAGWLIPIVVLFVISFPPLFGHEIVALLCGVVWGLWVGFGIVAAGTFAGESECLNGARCRVATECFADRICCTQLLVGTWFTFQKLLYKHCHKLERTNINYGALTRLARQSRFWVSILVTSRHDQHSDKTLTDVRNDSSSLLSGSRPFRSTFQQPYLPIATLASGSLRWRHSSRCQSSSSSSILACCSSARTTPRTPNSGSRRA